MIKRSLHDITPVSTSHNVGQKRVLLSALESGCDIKQIAITDLKAGEIAAVHIHPDLQEGFYVLSGDLDVTLDEQLVHCHQDDFVYVESCTSHELHAITDVRVMTIGCQIETKANKIYPFLFKPNLHSVIWGGDQLATWKGLDYQKGVGESWEVSAVESSPSVIANGVWTGNELPEVIAKMPEEILGRQVAKEYHNKLPLLVKFIDAERDLSIQVHPDDKMAQREHGKMGKTEMWYVLDAKPGACLYAGFKDELSSAEYKKRVADGTICDSLARHEVKAGDVFYIPAGRVHAICSGILLAEVQQSSDVTYRIFDYNRLGTDGKPRQLHTELAAKALDFKVEEDYKTKYASVENQSNLIIDSPFFSVRVTELTSSFHRNLIKYDSFVISMCLKGDCKIRIRSTQDEIELKEGNSCLIPAAIADYDVIPLGRKTKILDAYIDRMDRSLTGMITRLFHM